MKRLHSLWALASNDMMDIAQLALPPLPSLIVPPVDAKPILERNIISLADYRELHSQAQVNPVQEQ